MGKLLHALSRLWRLTDKLRAIEAHALQKERNNRVNVLCHSGEDNGVLTIKGKVTVESGFTSAILDCAISEGAIAERVVVERNRLVLKGSFRVVHAFLVLDNASFRGKAA